MSKQTAVEWLVEQLLEGKLLMPSLIEQAKAMEKNQMKEAALNDVTTLAPLRKLFEQQFENYYNEIYNGTENE